MPGRKKLAADLGVNHKTCESALKLLEAEGLLVSQGRGLGRRIVESATPRSPDIRVRILLYEKSAVRSYYMVELLHRLREAGHDASCAEKTMTGLGMDAGRISRYIGTIEADAWIVLAGPHDVLDWFARRPVPAFALYGRMKGLPMAGATPSKVDAMEELVDRLVGLGHERIVHLSREERRKPTPGFYEQRFLERLRGHGLPTSSYNLPDWEDCPKALEELLDSLFQHTPPTALLVDEVSVFIAVMQRLCRLGIVAPERVSLACADSSPVFDWYRPEITRFHWDPTPLVTRMVRWVNNVSLGKDDRRKTKVKAKLVIGGTIGPAPEGSGGPGTN